MISIPFTFTLVFYSSLSYQYYSQISFEIEEFSTSQAISLFILRKLFSINYSK
jgi:hypothetical protein